MKQKLLLVASLLIGGTVFSQINNPSFENWNTIHLYDGPADWNNGNSENEGMFQTTIWDTNAQHLAHSIRMETIDTMGDTIFGYVIQGEFGDLGPESGVPYSGGLPDSLIFWAKYDFVGLDSGTVLVNLFNSGVPSGMDLNKLDGNQSTWTRLAYKINALSIPDEILLAFASSNAFSEYGEHGSWFSVDNVQIKDTSGAIYTPDNYSFEVWDTTYVNEPMDWYTTNLFYEGDTTVFMTTDASVGTYAALLEVKAVNSDTLNALLSNAPVVNSWFDKVPYNAQPTSFDFDVKFIPSGTDTAHLTIDFYAGGSLIGGNFHMFDTTINTYTTLNVPLSIPSVPDSVRILFYAGENPGTQLFVDNVSFSGGTVAVTDNSSFSSFVIHYPNPANDILNVQIVGKKLNQQSTITVMDMQGKVILSKRVNKGLNTINLDALPKGTYAYSINFKNETVVNKFIKL